MIGGFSLGWLVKPLRLRSGADHLLRRRMHQHRFDRPAGFITRVVVYSGVPGGIRRSWEDKPPLTPYLRPTIRPICGPLESALGWVSGGLERLSAPWWAAC